VFRPPTVCSAGVWVTTPAVLVEQPPSTSEPASAAAAVTKGIRESIVAAYGRSGRFPCEG
jgi:hypothetical protein